LVWTYATRVTTSHVDIDYYGDGRVVVGTPRTDPASQPVGFYVKGRQVHSARLHIAGQSVLLPGTYTAPSGSSAGYTSFVFDAKDLPQAAGVYDCDLQLLNEYGNQLYDETGKALWQHVQLRMDGGSALPQVYQQVTVLNTGTKVTIKRFQDFNAFGEVSEERDERVGERMLAAINDDLTARNQATQGALTDTQKLAARTTLKYNVLGQLVAKLDPETFITLENGYRYRARPETRYGYDLLGRLTTHTDANGNLSRVQYLAGARGPDARVQREFDAAGGHADVLNVNGAGIRLNEYDVFGDSRRLTEAQGSDEQRTTERSYDKRGLLETVVRKGVQRLASGSAETLDTARDLSDTYTYDQLGQRLSATNALGIKTRTDYDALGRVVQTVSGNGFVTSYSYALRVVGQADGITGVAGSSSGGHVLTTTRADGRTLKDKIDYFGHTTWHQDLAGTEFTYGFNSAAQLVRQTSTKRAGQSKGQDIAYSYYANGYIRSIEDRAQAILSQYAYDNAGNRVYEGIFLTATDSQGGLTLADGAKAFQSATIVYDELNRISRVRDDNFFDVRYEFDANGNRRRITSTYWDGVAGLLGGGTQDYWYAYDSLNRFTVSKGRLERTATGTDASGSRGTSDADTRYRVSRGTEGTLIGYDKLSQRRSATYTYVSGNTSQTIDETYGYSQDGYLQTTKQGDKLVVTRRLDDIGRTTLLTDLVNYQSTQSSYDNDNRLVTQSIVGDTRNPGDAGKNYAVKYEYYTDKADTLSGVSQSGAGALARLTQAPAPQSGQVTLATQTTYTYDYWDDVRQSVITKSTANQSTTSTLRYDVNGHIKSNTDAGTGTRNYITNANGQVLQRSSGSVVHNYYYADGHRIGDVGNTPDDKLRVSYAEQLHRNGVIESADQRRERYKRPSSVTSADFDQNYEPINDSYPGNAASSYTVTRTGQTLREIAQALWGDSSLWYLIAETNGLLADVGMAAGQVLVIPNKVTNIHNNASTWRLYNAGEAIGAVDPNWSVANTEGLTRFYKELTAQIGRSAGATAAIVAAGDYMKQMTEQVLASQATFSWTMQQQRTAYAAGQQQAAQAAKTRPSGEPEKDRATLQRLAKDPAYKDRVRQELATAQGAGPVTAAGASQWFLAKLGYAMQGADSLSGFAVGGFGNAIGESLASQSRGVDWSKAPDQFDAETARLNRYEAQARGSEALNSYMASRPLPPADNATGAEVMAYRMQQAGFDGDLVPTAGSADNATRIRQLERNIRELKALSAMAKAPAGPRRVADGVDSGSDRLILEKPEILGYLSSSVPTIEPIAPVESLRLDPLTIESSLLANLPQPTEGFWFGATGGSRDPFDRTPMSFSEKGGAFTRGLVTSPITSTYGLLSEIGSQYRDMYNMVRSPSTFTPSSRLLSSYTYQGFGTTVTNIVAGLLEGPSRPIIDLLNGDYEQAGAGAPTMLATSVALPANLVRRPTVDLNRGAALRAKYAHLSPEARANRLENLAEANAARRLRELELSIPHAHFVEKHGAQTTLQAQLERVLYGKNPTTGVIEAYPNGNPKLPSAASRFFRNRDQLNAINRARHIFATTGDVTLAQRPIPFQTLIGEGYTKTPLSYREYHSARVWFRQGEPTTAFPMGD
jgi:YD repeat-containing protein